MWSNFLDFLRAVFRGKGREYQRADFEAVATQWENLVDVLKEQIDDQREQLKVQHNQIIELQTRLVIVQDEAEQCLRQAAAEAKRVIELELKVARLESLVRLGGGEHVLDRTEAEQRAKDG